MLLKNEQELLPLDRNSLRSIAVIGPHADQCYLGPGYVGIASKSVSPLEGVRNAVGSDVAVRYVKGCDIVDDPPAEANLAEAAEAARSADAAIVVVDTDRRIEAENRDRSSLGLPGRQRELVETVCRANPRTIVVLVNGGPLTIR